MTAPRARTARKRGRPGWVAALGRGQAVLTATCGLASGSVTVYVEQFSAHPLERDVAELYGPPDGYIDTSGVFHKDRQSASDKPVYAVTLKPEDGLYPLPYMAVQADGSPWDSNATRAGAPFEKSRQTFYPDASRIFEEIEREGANLQALASFDFYRAAPSGGYTKGLKASERTDIGTGKGFFFQPTVFADVKPDMTISREEIFGPVATVMAGPVPGGRLLPRLSRVHDRRGP